MLTLYHLTGSHFSEKARWALQFKGLEYRSRVLTPGFHMLTTRRLGGGTTVPVLVDDDSGSVIPDSTDILHYLDRIRPDPPLFPLDGQLASAVVEIEEIADTGWGKNASAYAYSVLLESPRDVRLRWNRGLNLVQRGLLWAVMPICALVMTRRRGLNATMAPKYLQAAAAAYDELETRLQANGGAYFVGAEFTAADLTVAALLAPFIDAPGSPWCAPPGAAPAAVEDFKRRTREQPLGQWALRVWQEHRR